MFGVWGIRGSLGFRVGGVRVSASGNNGLEFSGLGV